MVRWMVGVTWIVLAGCTANTIDLDGDGAADEGTAGATAGSSTAADTAPVVDGEAEAEVDSGPVVTTLPTPDGDDGDDGDDGKPEPLGLREGRYLLALDSIVQPGLPLQWEVNVTPDAFSGQSLSLVAGSTTDPRLPVGGVWQAALTVSGEVFTVVVPPLQILPEANPVTGSELILSEVLLEGVDKGLGFYCGKASGSIESPVSLNLDGSSFALVPVEPDAAWPIEFPLGC